MTALWVFVQQLSRWRAVVVVAGRPEGSAVRRAGAASDLTLPNSDSPSLPSSPPCWPHPAVWDVSMQTSFPVQYSIVMQYYRTLLSSNPPSLRVSGALHPVPLVRVAIVAISRVTLTGTVLVLLIPISPTKHETGGWWWPRYS